MGEWGFFSCRAITLLLEKIFSVGTLAVPIDVTDLLLVRIFLQRMILVELVVGIKELVESCDTGTDAEDGNGFDFVDYVDREGTL